MGSGKMLAGVSAGGGSVTMGDSLALPGSGRPRCAWLWLLLATVLVTGCSPSAWLAHRMRQAPNTFPRVLGPKPLVYYSFPESWLTNFPAREITVGPPTAKLACRIVPPADYGFHITGTNWPDGARRRYRFDFRATVPGPTNGFTATPRGTLFLLHGYGVDANTMLQWALTLAGDGWRCVLVDLRGHGASTGKQVFFGARESLDLGQLANYLDRHAELPRPVAVLGASYGAALALKWAGEDARLERVIALTPYAELAPAVLAIRDGYAGWIPRGWVRRAAARLPAIVGVSPGGLDPAQWLTGHPVPALFIATDHDPIAPPEAVQRLHALALPGSEYRHLATGIHETAPFQFEELLPDIRTWLNRPAPTP